MLKHWTVLVVDDSTDVLTTSRLALKGLTFYDLPIKVVEAKSKAEAIAFLNDDPEAKVLAAAFIDVVMESDTSGLELCSYIRETHKNPHVQIIVRTGQPGKAPERDVVDRYDISGYLAKVDATDQRLYSVLKTALRQFATSTQAFTNGLTLRMLASAATSRDTFMEMQKQIGLARGRDSKGRKIASYDESFAWISGDSFVGIGRYEDRAKALKVRDALRALPAEAGISFDRDRVVSNDGELMVSLAAVGNEPAVDYIAPSLATVEKAKSHPRGRTSIESAVEYQRTVRTLWTLAGR